MVRRSLRIRRGEQETQREFLRRIGGRGAPSRTPTTKIIQVQPGQSLAQLKQTRAQEGLELIDERVAVFERLKSNAQRNLTNAIEQGLDSERIKDLRRSLEETSFRVEQNVSQLNALRDEAQSGDFSPSDLINFAESKASAVLQRAEFRRELRKAPTPEARALPPTATEKTLQQSLPANLRNLSVSEVLRRQSADQSLGELLGGEFAPQPTRPQLLETRQPTPLEVERRQTLLPPEQKQAIDFVESGFGQLESFLGDKPKFDDERPAGAVAVSEFLLTEPGTLAEAFTTKETVFGKGAELVKGLFVGPFQQLALSIGAVGELAEDIIPGSAGAVTRAGFTGVASLIPKTPFGLALVGTLGLASRTVAGKRIVGGAITGISIAQVADPDATLSERIGAGILGTAGLTGFAGPEIVRGIKVIGKKLPPTPQRFPPKFEPILDELALALRKPPKPSKTPLGKTFAEGIRFGPEKAPILDFEIVPTGPSRVGLARFKRTKRIQRAVEQRLDPFKEIKQDITSQKQISILLEKEGLAKPRIPKPTPIQRLALRRFKEKQRIGIAIETRLAPTKDLKADFQTRIDILEKLGVTQVGATKVTRPTKTGLERLKQRQRIQKQTREGVIEFEIVGKRVPKVRRKAVKRIRTIEDFIDKEISEPTQQVRTRGRQQLVQVQKVVEEPKLVVRLKGAAKQKQKVRQMQAQRSLELREPLQLTRQLQKRVSRQRLIPLFSERQILGQVQKSGQAVKQSSSQKLAEPTITKQSQRQASGLAQPLRELQLAKQIQRPRERLLTDLGLREPRPRRPKRLFFRRAKPIKKKKPRARTFKEDQFLFEGFVSKVLQRQGQKILRKDIVKEFRRRQKDPFGPRLRPIIIEDRKKRKKERKGILNFLK